jgi:hypothetical protein
MRKGGLILALLLAPASVLEIVKVLIAMARADTSRPPHSPCYASIAAASIEYWGWNKKNGLPLISQIEREAVEVEIRNWDNQSLWSLIVKEWRSRQKIRQDPQTLPTIASFLTSRVLIWAAG